MLPGDQFEASNRDARLLIAIKKAEAVREQAEVPPPPPEVAEKIKAAVTPKPLTFVEEPYAGESPPAADERIALRAEYETALGKKPFTGWSADDLRDKIAAAKKV